LALLFAGCAPKNYDYLTTDKSIAQSKRLPLKLYPQETYYCGPSALAVLLSNSNIQFNYDEMANNTFTPKLKGTLQPQMKATLRKYGLIPYEIDKNIKSVLSELSNDTPVLILFNLGLNMIPVWHYSVATGFDMKERKIFLSAPKGDETWMGFEEFETFFERGGKWAIVGLKPPLIPSSASEREIIGAILDMYDIGAKDVARHASMGYVSKNPTSYLGVVTLANMYFLDEEFKSASFTYKEALDIKPKDPIILNNLAISLSKQNKLEEAKKYALEAVSIGGVFIEKYKNTLMEIENTLKEQK
jgi:tetratricopeptide (TPR) repeat protein